VESFNLKAPFLKKVVISKTGKTEYPFNLPLFSDGLKIEFTKPITFFVGENGSGKSTILEAIAAQCGFSLTGGNRNHTIGNPADQVPLASATKLFWLPKVTKGFFVRAESSFDFATQIDEIAKEAPVILTSYGDKSLHAQSHGESFLSLFNNHFGQDGLYILASSAESVGETTIGIG
jgi:predicted ATPase